MTATWYRLLRDISWFAISGELVIEVTARGHAVFKGLLPRGSLGGLVGKEPVQVLPEKVAKPSALGIRLCKKVLFDHSDQKRLSQVFRPSMSAFNVLDQDVAVDGFPVATEKFVPALDALVFGQVPGISSNVQAVVGNWFIVRVPMRGAGRTTRLTCQSLCHGGR